MLQLSLIHIFLLMSTRIKTAMLLFQSDSLSERLETVVVMKVKSDYLNYAESDIDFEYEGIPISIVYDKMQARVSVYYSDKTVGYLITFNDLDECIMNFEYLN